MIETAQFWSMLQQLLRNSRLPDMQYLRHHGVTSVLDHSIAVAYYSNLTAAALERLGIRFSRGELVRGALMHDYFLYDWHDGTPDGSLHGLTHPLTAWRNAMQDVPLSVREQDIIKKHMFPLTLTPPKYRESALVCLIDKLCAVYESLNPNPYKTLHRRMILATPTV